MSNGIPEEFKKGLYYGSRFDTIVIPERYAKRVVGHVVSNYLSNNHYFTPPLYLAIKGSPGEGKTMQALAACNQRGIMVKYLSASELSGQMESASRDAIKEVYIQTQRLKELGYIVCLLLDDFHLGNSNIRKDNGHTVNAELLVGYMMNLNEESRNRVPIILTGNDFSNTYGALLRDGRADIYEWEPKEKEKLMVVKSILQPFVSENNYRELEEFIVSYKNRNIAFFAQIRTDIRQRIIYEALDGVEKINKESMGIINSFVNENLSLVDISELYKLADERIDNRQKGGL